MFSLGEYARFTFHDGSVVQGRVINVEYTAEVLVVWINDEQGMMHRCMMYRNQELQNAKDK